ncbi:hypothetical protein [Arthrobacter sp. zg-Y179]|nr:hypothetical protein [Arthrobacter sp. zg-Y179]MCC9175511.1 hypothetical protein [Arthrobacter sp. zg-Y179]
MSEQSANEEKDSNRTHPQEPSEGDTTDQKNEQREHTQEPAEGGEDQT